MQDKLQWLTDPNQINGYKLNNVRQTSNHFKKKKMVEQQQY
jgi:hypothetical protein